MKNEEKKIDSNFDHKKFGRKIGYLISAVMQIIFITVINKYYPEMKFLTSDFSKFLWAFNVAVFVSVMVDIILIFYDAYRFKAFLGLFKNIFSWRAFYILYVTFPFDFSKTDYSQGKITVKTVIIIILAGVSIGIIVDFFKLVLGKKEPKKS